MRTSDRQPHACGPTNHGEPAAYGCMQALFSPRAGPQAAQSAEDPLRMRYTGEQGVRCISAFGHRGNVVAARQPARQACQRDSQPATSVPWARSFQRRRSTGCPSTASSRTCATTRSGVSSACKHLPRPARQGGPAALALGDNGRRLRSHRACTRPGAQPYFVQALGPLTCACLGRDL
jgi:hypothetical protein